MDRRVVKEKAITGRILFIDDDRSGREVALFNLRKAGYDVTPASDGREGLAIYSQGKFDLVVTDLKMPVVDGMEVLETVHRISPETPVLVITAFGNIETAVEAMRRGAVDFIGKPFHRDQMLLSVEKALERRRLVAEVRELRIRTGGVEREIVYASPVMRRLIEMADRVATSDATILITGESGTGKEVVARRIHVRSPRADKPFVAINCAAIPGELLESELFGHTRGAFTGAVRERSGKFRQADSGTLFLDEIGEIPMSLQPKLLRALQERVVDVVGGDVPVEVDVRVIAATNKDLKERIREGRFREDLYYRLNVVELHVPPLRERPEDVPLLVDYFIRELDAGKEMVIPPRVMEELGARPWPGNVRELRNACERIAILGHGREASIDDLPPAPTGAREEKTAADVMGLSFPPLPAEGLSLIDLEKEVIGMALRRKKGNITQAAAYLRIPRHILVYRIEKYGLRRDS